MSRKRFLYHVTAPENVSDIMLGGLKRGGGIRQAAAVYLSEKPLSWYQSGLVILKVDISGLQSVPATTFLPESDEVLFWGDIPAWKQTKNGLVRRITVVTEKFAVLPDCIPRHWCMIPDGCYMCDRELCSGEPKKGLKTIFVTSRKKEEDDAE